jgi:hypothetical protein
MDNNEQIEVKTPSEYALQKAAQAWCKPTTQMKIMDAALATAFAEILDEERKDYNNLKQQNICRKRLVKALEDKLHEVRQQENLWACSIDRAGPYGQSVICCLYC